MNSVLAQYPSHAMLPEGEVVPDKFFDCNIVSLSISALTLCHHKLHRTIGKKSGLGIWKGVHEKGWKQGSNFNISWAIDKLKNRSNRVVRKFVVKRPFHCVIFPRLLKIPHTIFSIHFPVFYFHRRVLGKSFSIEFGSCSPWQGAHKHSSGTRSPVLLPALKLPQT